MIQNTNIVDIDYIDRLKDVVIRDIKNEASQQEKDMLEGNVDMWLYNLRVIRRDVEFQLSSNKAKNKIKALEMKDMGASTADVESFITKQNKWRINTIKFLTSIERKMLYVKMINNPLD
jgi:predicted  nucleic acid-binding Zn ribbon protein